ncbi:MAG: DUF3566 domain-containing protein [bacterium]
MKLEIKSIGIWSLIKISVFIHLIVGFIFGVFYAFMLSFMSSAGVLPLDIMGNEDITLLGMIIIVPIMFSIGGAVFGTIWVVICVFIYNLLAKLIGGLEINTEDITVKLPTPIHTQQAAASMYVRPDSSIKAPPPPPSRPENINESTTHDDEKKSGPDRGNNYEI